MPSQTAFPTPFASTGPGTHRPQLACYFPLGDPLVPVELLDLYADAGVDVIEIGLSAANPTLDGAEVRASMARADRNRARADLEQVLERLARRRHAPATLLMGYAEATHPGRGVSQFWSGLDSTLVVRPDPAAEELARGIEACAAAAGLRPSAFLALPLTDDSLAMARAAGFYVMLQAAEGVTGQRATVDPGNAARIARLRAGGVTRPILPGFGISTGAQARALCRMGADGVVVGSTVLRAALKGRAALAGLLAELRDGLDG